MNYKLLREVQKEIVGFSTRGGGRLIFAKKKEKGKNTNLKHWVLGTGILVILEYFT